MAWLKAREDEGTFFSREDRFVFQGQGIRLMNPQTGIWKPRGWNAALSISTVFTSPTGRKPYADSEISPDGLGRYKWRGDDPLHADNCALRNAMELDLPLIWFLRFAPGRYTAVYPVFLLKEEPELQQFVVAVDAIHQLGSEDIKFPRDYVEIAYGIRETKQRLHQAPFRARVLDAYRCKCAVCRFGHASLLDAAHIVPDSEGGPASVTNGLSLCKMHHGAYDSKIIGITPDLMVEVNHDVLHEIDGPMLQHGIQEFHRQRLMVIPTKRSQQPDPEALQLRYNEFLAHA